MDNDRFRGDSWLFNGVWWMSMTGLWWFMSDDFSRFLVTHGSWKPFNTCDTSHKIPSPGLLCRDVFPRPAACRHFATARRWHHGRCAGSSTGTCHQGSWDLWGVAQLRALQQLLPWTSRTNVKNGGAGAGDDDDDDDIWRLLILISHSDDTNLVDRHRCLPEILVPSSLCLVQNRKSSSETTNQMMIRLWVSSPWFPHH